MKKIMIYIFSVLMLLFCNISIAGCAKAKDYRGIIEHVDCEKAVFCKFENFEERYIDVSFEVTINNNYYIDKELLFIALNEDDIELHRQKCIFDNSKKYTFSYKEYSDAFQYGQGIANTFLQTKKIQLLEGSTVIGSANIHEIKVYMY